MRADAADVLGALRPHHWAKNLLVFVPLVLTPSLVASPSHWLSAAIAFAGLCLCASAGYLVNDCQDIEADRAHPTKRERPFARGVLSRTAALTMAAGLAMLGLVVAARGGGDVLRLAGLYLVLTAAYSLWLKRLLLLDVILLAGLYTLRILAGAAAVSVAPTPWLLAFSLFIFTSLALVKRYGELALTAAGEPILGRGYRPEDRGLVAMLGSSAGLLSVLVLCLYINSDDVRRLYANVDALWLLCPLLLYWVGRLWFLAGRGQLPDDPVAFAIRDPTSLATGALALGVLVAANLP